MNSADSNKGPRWLRILSGFLFVLVVVPSVVLLFCVRSCIVSWEDNSPGGPNYATELSRRVRQHELTLLKIAREVLRTRQTVVLSSRSEFPEGFARRAFVDDNENVYFLSGGWGVGSDWGFVLRNGNTDLGLAHSSHHLFDDWWAYRGD